RGKRKSAPARAGAGMLLDMSSLSAVGPATKRARTHLMDNRMPGRGGGGGGGTLVIGALPGEAGHMEYAAAAAPLRALRAGEHSMSPDFGRSYGYFDSYFPTIGGGGGGGGSGGSGGGGGGGGGGGATDTLLEALGVFGSASSIPRPPMRGHGRSFSTGVLAKTDSPNGSASLFRASPAAPVAAARGFTLGLPPPPLSDIGSALSFPSPLARMSARMSPPAAAAAPAAAGASAVAAAKAITSMSMSLHDAGTDAPAAPTSMAFNGTSMTFNGSSMDFNDRG
ncbi:MAG: hypothetical protein ACK4NM_18595, partial [Hydrogenophaga sp.]